MQSRKVLGMEIWKPVPVKVKGWGTEGANIVKKRASNRLGQLLLIWDMVPIHSMTG